MKKLLISILISIILPFSVFADSESLKTEITTVSFGPRDFGFNLAPTGTNFVFYNSCVLFPQLQYAANFSLRLNFSINNNHSFYGYNYKTGTPKWIHKYVEIEDIPEYHLSGFFFKPEAYVSVSLSQGFGTNPVAQGGPLLTLSFSFDSRYSMALESLDVHSGDREPVFFNPTTNDYNTPFGPNSQISVYPWLQDNRKSLINDIELYARINLSETTGFGVSDGVSIIAGITYGPKWLANNISMAYPTSDYVLLSTTLRENLTLYTREQENGFNWLSIMLSHANTYEYMSGSIIPDHMMPPDRLNQYFSDNISLTFNGPQFIASDCYTDLTLSLINTCYFGHILHEPSKTTHVMEWNSNLRAHFHLRLFGFMHFSYDIGYSLYSGIHNEFPEFWQKAKINFYISL